ncbi:MAG: hypothetical protein PUF66_02010 [Clostridium sp.]|nr:hypothetical protein [Clostridium sp.]
MTFHVDIYNIFFKRLYKDYLLLIIKKDKLLSFNIDNRIISILSSSSNNILEVLTTNSINYIIVDNLDIIEIKTFTNNSYNLYKKKAYLITLSNIIINKDHTSNV